MFVKGKNLGSRFKRLYPEGFMPILLKSAFLIQLKTSITAMSRYSHRTLVSTHEPNYKQRKSDVITPVHFMHPASGSSSQMLRLEML